jgi:hypothetical protein
MASQKILVKLREVFLNVLVYLRRNDNIIYKYFREDILKYFMRYDNLCDNAWRSCYEGYVFYIYMLLKHFKDTFDPSFDENDLLTTCVLKSNINMVKLLLSDSRVNPMDRELFIINAAGAKRNLDIYKLLLEHPKTILTDVEPRFKKNKK